MQAVGNGTMAGLMSTGVSRWIQALRNDDSRVIVGVQFPCIHTELDWNHRSSGA